MVESRSTQQTPAETFASGRSIAEITQFHEKREALLARLIFTSRSLAEHQFITRGGVQLCTDCDVWQSSHNRSHHPTCKTGRVLGILADLADLIASNFERSMTRDDSFPAAAVEERPRAIDSHFFERMESLVEGVFQKYGFVPVGISVDEEFAGQVRATIRRELGSEGGE